MYVILIRKKVLFGVNRSSDQQFIYIEDWVRGYQAPETVDLFSLRRVDPGSSLICQQEGIPVGCVPSAGVAVGGGGGLSAGEGVSAQGWVSAWEGVCPGGVCPSACWDTPPVNRMTDACENVTSATTLRTVKNDKL